jgi:hypothetical protein
MTKARQSKKIDNPSVDADTYAGFPTDFRGLTYQQEILDDEDTRKLIHYALKLNGGEPPVTLSPGENSFIFDWSPYSVPDQEDWELWIKLGLPGRMGIGALSKADLILMRDHLDEFDVATRRVD